MTNAYLPHWRVDLGVAEHHWLLTVALPEGEVSLVLSVLVFREGHLVMVRMHAFTIVKISSHTRCCQIEVIVNFASTLAVSQVFIRLSGSLSNVLLWCLLLILLLDDLTVWKWWQPHCDLFRIAVLWWRVLLPYSLLLFLLLLLD